MRCSCVCTPYGYAVPVYLGTGMRAGTATICTRYPVPFGALWFRYGCTDIRVQFVLGPPVPIPGYRVRGTIVPGYPVCAYRYLSRARTSIQVAVVLLPGYRYPGTGTGNDGSNRASEAAQHEGDSKDLIRLEGQRSVQCTLACEFQLLL